MNSKKMRAVAEQCARLIESELGREMHQGGARSKRAILQAVARKLPLQCGRKRNRLLDEAVPLRAQGMGLRQILGALTPGFWLLPRSEQICQVEWLRKGLQRRRKRAKKEAGKLPPPNAEDDKGSGLEPSPEASIRHEVLDASASGSHATEGRALRPRRARR